MASGKLMAAGSAYFTGRAAHIGTQLRQLPAFVEQSGAGGVMNGGVDTTTAQQRFVGCIDDRVNLQRGDISLPYLDLHDADLAAPAMSET
jgi:hypothetical protein